MLSLDAKILPAMDLRVSRFEKKLSCSGVPHYQRTKDRAASVSIKLEPIVSALFAIMISELA